MHDFENKDEQFFKNINSKSFRILLKKISSPHNLIKRKDFTFGTIYYLARDVAAHEPWHGGQDPEVLAVLPRTTCYFNLKMVVISTLINIVVRTLKY